MKDQNEQITTVSPTLREAWLLNTINQVIQNFGEGDQIIKDILC